MKEAREKSPTVPDANELPHVVVLGGGPAGVGAAFQLRRLGRARVTLIEANPAVGGNSGSFDHAGQRLDYGSHRLHPACDPAILEDIRTVLAGDLLDRPRHGRIRLRGRWIHFPLKPIDLLLRLDPGFALGTMHDMIRRRSKSTKPTPGIESFASVLHGSLGETICRDFYFPYARKIWGAEPEELSAIQARRRVSAGSFGKLLRKLMSAVPGFKPPGSGRFFYPRRGFGQISEAFAAAASKSGADIMLGWRVTGVERDGDAWAVRAESGAETRTMHADYLWSTLPITMLARMTTPPPDEKSMAASGAVQYRAMLLVYLTLPVPQFTEFDAHYFPERAVTITRLSEPKNYSALDEPHESTTLCAELPCAPGDAYWEMSDAQLGAIVVADLARSGLPLPAEATSVYVKRLRFAYPIYRHGYERAFAALDDWASEQPNMLTFGRQGLFAHDNTHHALRMAYAASDCLGADGFDLGKWGEYRREFEGHVVED
ncbi:MAG: FAD-dependent oxidoreductase [Gemmatimonadaceae bacterium]